MSASSILSAWVSIQLTKLGARIFRNSVGMAYQGDAQKVKVGKEDAVLIKNPRYLPFGLLTKAIDKKKKNAGSSDKIGWTPVLMPAGYSHMQIIAAFLAGRESIGSEKSGGDSLAEFLELPGMVPDIPFRTVAVFTAVEEKTLAYRKLTPDQINFLDQVVKAGGIAYVARETNDGPVLNKWPE